MPLGLRIDDTDIDNIADVLGVSFDDEDRRNALRSAKTCDIQACPGSGKTTLLVAKLAILARKWPWRTQGICVLSHTNAARHEVEHRLAGYPAAHHLLGYPHFVGTIQAFVDRFLALPAVREMGLEVTMVDNDRSAKRAEQLLQKCYSAKAFLGRRKNGLAIARGLRLEGPNLMLGSSEARIPCGQDSKTYKELTNIKRWLLQDGIIRYDDMYAFGEKYVVEHPWTITALRHRFPWVFVDEMQDTDLIQDTLLQKLFGDGCILQRFGDSNQAIFWGIEVDAQRSFPHEGHLELPESKRFGQIIANFATPLTQAVSPQELVGFPDTESKNHMIFLFDDDSVLRVLHAFGELIAAEYSTGLPSGFIAKAIGFRKTPPSDTEAVKVPYSIGHYHPTFNPDVALRSNRPGRLFGFIHKSNLLLRSSEECKEATDVVLDGVLELLHIVDATDTEGMRLTKTRLLDTLVEEDDGLLLRFRIWLASLILNTQVPTKKQYQTVIGRLFEMLDKWLPDELPERATEFLSWNPADEAVSDTAEGHVPREANVYLHDSDIAPVYIELSTIHGAKGQTHTATLVLETFDRAHDLKMVLKFLKGGKAGKNPPVKHMKRVFVAMTRPRELLCLAMRRDHLSDKDIEALLRRGWSIGDLTSTT